ncbi:MAG TPA: NAD(P)H-dependent oxidoreductase [Gammaproteobacteria bacterium]|jgi:putative NADPH-quinone reductase|nr:NAD(P)H-dependent oxidoreductase [Gammaproteobacteria bacterium]
MKTILYVYAHPNRESLNHSIMMHAAAELERNDVNVIVSDLYSAPLDISAEQKKIASANHIIFQFPLWWFSAPAIMKAWLDNVLTKGFAYDIDKQFANGLLRDKTASLTVTMQSPENAYQPPGIHGTNLKNFLLPFHHTLRFTGIKPLATFAVFSALEMNQSRYRKMLDQYTQYLSRILTSNLL